MHSDTSADERDSFVERARRAQIVQATIDVLAEQGYSGASFARIAQRASISPGLINYHFRTKGALMRDVLATIDQRLDTAMASPADEEPDSYQAALEGMLLRFAEHCWTHGEEIRARTEIHQARSEVLREAVVQAHDRGMAELVSFIGEGQEYGQFRKVDPALFASVLMSAMGEFPRLRGRSADEHRRIAADWVSLFVNAISVTGSTA